MAPPWRGSGRPRLVSRVASSMANGAWVGRGSCARCGRRRSGMRQCAPRMVRMVPAPIRPGVGAPTRRGRWAGNAEGMYRPARAGLRGSPSSVRRRPRPTAWTPDAERDAPPPVAMASPAGPCGGEFPGPLPLEELPIDQRRERHQLVAPVDQIGETRHHLAPIKACTAHPLQAPLWQDRGDPAIWRKCLSGRTLCRSACRMRQMPVRDAGQTFKIRSLSFSGAEPDNRQGAWACRPSVLLRGFPRTRHQTDPKPPSLGKAYRRSGGLRGRANPDQTRFSATRQTAGPHTALPLTRRPR